MSERKYPRTCGTCRAKRVNPVVLEEYTTLVNYNGCLMYITVPLMPVEQCGKCNEFTIGDDGDKAIEKAAEDHIGSMGHDF